MHVFANKEHFVPYVLNSYNPSNFHIQHHPCHNLSEKIVVSKYKLSSVVYCTLTFSPSKNAYLFSLKRYVVE